MMLLRFLIGAVIPRLASAESCDTPSCIEQLGKGAPGIDAMWFSLQQRFPHSDQAYGSLGFLLIIGKIMSFVLQFIAGAAALVLVYGGIRMIMTVSDENAHAEAKKIVIWSIVGLLLAGGADIVIVFVRVLACRAAGGTVDECGEGILLPWW